MTPTDVELRDRARGCILAGAIGDAMGGPFEGQPGPLQYQDHAPWSISDDTQLTLATCESIIQSCSVSPDHIASRFAAWFRERRVTGMGSSTLKALRDLEMGAHWALSGAKGEMRSGNGAAMRAAPLAFHLDPSDRHDRRLLRDVSRITHHNEESYIGALAVVLAIRDVAFQQPSSTEELADRVASDLPDSRVRDRLKELAHLEDRPTVAQVGSTFGCSSYVAESVPLALYAARLIDRIPLVDVLRGAIEAGGDTDTIASIAGQIAGAWIGAREIPAELVHSLPATEGIPSIAEEFADTLMGVT